MTRSLFYIAPALLLSLAVLPAKPEAGPPASLLDTGYRQMYNLEFDAAHQTFGEWERSHPDDPMGPASNAAAYLFAEFDRLHILQSEFFVHDSNFTHAHKLVPDPAVRQAFDRELTRAAQLEQKTLGQSPDDANALFATILNRGLRADYDALIEKRYLASLRGLKDGRILAEKLLAIDPTYYDAHLAIGVENYMLSLKPAPVRWLLQVGGAQTDGARGLEKLRLTAEKGHYLRPYARLLLAVAALRDKDRNQAREILQDLARQFPKNRLYGEELALLH